MFAAALAHVPSMQLQPLLLLSRNNTANAARAAVRGGGCLDRLPLKLLRKLLLPTRPSVECFKLRLMDMLSDCPKRAMDLQ